jgi:hypothetical protein
MDAIFPYLIRRTPAAEPSQRLIEPVTKYTRFSPDEHGHHHAIWHYRISARQEESRQQQQQTPQQHSAQQADKPESEYLPTSHAVTPENEQHTDADGHLDIYV